MATHTGTLKYEAVQNYINGRFQDEALEALEVHSPLDGTLLTTVPLSTEKTLDQAVQAAKNALPQWSAATVKERVQIFYTYRNLLLENLDRLSELICAENGKTFSEARAELEKSVELTEFACSMPQMVGEEVLEVSRGVECRIERRPVGVVASITPFNFPSMVPHWSIPNALVLGNTMIVKPSEKVPLSLVEAAKLLQKAGLPDGVFNIVNGDKTIVEAICDHPDIGAISFVGSTAVAKTVYRRGTSNLKRVLAMGGAKNHLIVLPDAHVAMTATNVIASVTGCAGQRCMAAAAMIAVGNTEEIIDRICEEARKMEPGKDIGAVISKAALQRIENYITQAEQQGAKIRVDGRGVKIPGRENGYYVGATVIDQVSPDMAIAREEVFGPVLAIMRSQSLKEAISIENANPYGNAAAVFTQNGGAAREVINQASAGMIGVNVGVPVPREPFSFGGWNESKFGALDITGKSSIEFWTQLKKVTTKWNAEAGINWMS
ncbi:CoA-acylating methylmalonate-semialdehyde dehydrogenase [Robiginitalea sp.]|uniref:CoA-acylating methylmalonate-semialdehyde dehydrogenase n=2 Tax=Robiginitalea sp. TaxID=1902411 RepID=UPI003C7576A5